MTDVLHDQHAEFHEPACDPMCSSRRCTAHATWALRWNNPRLHARDRRKTWLACDEHREHLTSFLQLRGFLREVEVLLARTEAEHRVRVG